MGNHPSTKRKSEQLKATIGVIAVWPFRGPAVGDRYRASPALVVAGDERLLRGDIGGLEKAL